MNREKVAWLLSTVLIALLAFQIPGTLAHRDDDYSFVRTLIDIHRQVSANYVEAVDDAKLQQAAIEGMVGQLDPYTNYVPPANQEAFDNMLEGSFRGVGIQLDQKPNGDIEVITPIDNSPAARAGVEPGDVIVKVGGEDIHNVKLEEVIKKVKGPIGTPITITFRSPEGKVRDLTMNRDDIVVPTIKGFKRRADAKASDADPWDYWVSRDEKIGYVRITQFTGDTFETLKKALTKLREEGMKGLIIDVRFNPGGRLDQARDIVNLFVRDGVIVKVKGRARQEEIFTAKPEGALPGDFPLAVLANEHSASASEILSGSLKDNRRALIVGSRTFGKGSVQEVIPLEGNGGELKLTVAYYYLPSGRLVHRKKDSTDWGVDPDISVPMSPEQEARLVADESDRDVMRHSSSAAGTQPTTRPVLVDPQFDAALQAVADEIHGRKPALTAVPATAPSTQPSRQ